MPGILMDEVQSEFELEHIPEGVCLSFEDFGFVVELLHGPVEIRCAHSAGNTENIHEAPQTAPGCLRATPEKNGEIAFASPAHTSLPQNLHSISRESEPLKGKI
jgi:hypothetical protein